MSLQAISNYDDTQGRSKVDTVSYSADPLRIILKHERAACLDLYPYDLEGDVQLNKFERQYVHQYINRHIGK